MDLDALTTQVDDLLRNADRALARDYPGERPTRQPIHTVYVPADQYDAETVGRWGREAETAVLTHAEVFLQAIGGDEDLLARVLEKLAREPVEDLRIDFEDGYGPRGDDEEDAAATAAGEALRDAMKHGESSPFSGIRFKSFDPRTRHRGLRTLYLFLQALGEIPEGFTVTLPKVTSVDQVDAMVRVAKAMEREVGGRLLFELQIETPQSILGTDGTALVAKMIHASRNRCLGLHYGTYDYSAFCAVPASQQSLEHPVADHAKAIMQAAAAGTGVRLSDGSTNVLPVGDDAQMRTAWDNHLRLVRRALDRGFYQGWDLHPAQLASRYAATYDFFVDGFRDSVDRLKKYVEHTGSAVLDEPATARAMADFCLRGMDCGAFTLDEVIRRSGLDGDTLARLALRPTVE
jgi:citrate lyase beta subunit